MHDRIMKWSQLSTFGLCISVVGVLIPANAAATPDPSEESPIPAEERPLPATTGLPQSGTTNSGGRNDIPVVDAGTTSDGVISVGIGVSDSGDSGGIRSSPPTIGPTCQWNPLRGDTSAGNNGGSPLPGGGEQATDSQGRLGWTVNCPGQALEVRWVAPAVDPADYISQAADRARAQLPLPVPVQSPAPDVGSIVNLGLWFSIDDPGVTTARATAAGAWAEVTGRFAGFTIDPGDGTEPFGCEGFGVAYEDGTNNADQGPCGHTYLQPTPDDQPHTVTYTITYNLSWRLSDGRTGQLGTFDRSYSFPFDINEVQTVGTGR